jgi:type I restriction enzyme S subunit
MNYVLNSFRFWAYARSQAFVSLHQANLNSSRYGRMGVPVPPREEQDGIVSHIEESASEIDTAIARTEREIALVQEYRARLTSDVVTGKLDVRVAAAQLPEIAPEDVSVIESQAANQEPALEEADE